MNKKQICDSKGKDFHKLTKRCVKKCNAGEKRNKTFKCIPTKKLCDSKGKDFNRFTKKCIKKCNIEKKRYFYCPTKPSGLVNNPKRNNPCDKTKFGIYEGKKENQYGRTPGKKNYGTYCYPKCSAENMKLNIATNRCRHYSKDKKESITQNKI
jgi:hypothetical protein